jgi:inorganic pyrophosphatase
VPESLALDDDPLDVLVVTPFPLISGTVIEARPVGVMNMIDEAGDDSKLVCVPIDRLSRLYRQVRHYNDLPAPLIEQLGHFFEHYKDLEPNKWVEIKGWEGPDEARRQIVEALALYKSTS